MRPSRASPYPSRKIGRSIQMRRLWGVVMRPELIETARRLSVGEARGFRGRDGLIDLERNGAHWFIFREPDDLVYFRPDTGEIALWNGRAFALGAEQIGYATTFSLDAGLKIVSSVERWLECRGAALFVLDWSRAFMMLQTCPRLQIDESIRSKYNQAMRPTRMPAVRTALGR